MCSFKNLPVYSIIKLVFSRHVKEVSIFLFKGSLFAFNAEVMFLSRSIVPPCVYFDLPSLKEFQKEVKVFYSLICSRNEHLLHDKCNNKFL